MKTTTIDTAAAVTAAASNAAKGGAPATLREYVYDFLGSLDANVAASVPEIREALAASPWADAFATACAKSNPRIRQMVERMWRAGEVERFDGNPKDGNGRTSACYAVVL